MDEATSEDLAFTNRHRGNPTESGPRTAWESSGQWIPKTRHFCPSESKAARFQASLSSPQRWGTMPAPPSNGFLTHCPSLILREGRRGNGVKNLTGARTSLNAIWSLTHTKWKRTNLSTVDHLRRERFLI